MSAEAVVVVDASAGVELVAETVRGKALRRLIPHGADLAVPEHFLVEVSTVLRRWELNGVLKTNEAAEAFDRLLHWPVRRVAVEPLLEAAWSYRHNLTVADALYVVLADRLNASLLTDDRNLANRPTFPAHIARLTVPSPQR